MISDGRRQKTPHHVQLAVPVCLPVRFKARAPGQASGNRADGVVSLSLSLSFFFFRLTQGKPFRSVIPRLSRHNLPHAKGGKGGGVRVLACVSSVSWCGQDSFVVVCSGVDNEARRENEAELCWVVGWCGWRRPEPRMPAKRLRVTERFRGWWISGILPLLVLPQLTCWSWDVTHLAIASFPHCAESKEKLRLRCE